MSEAELLQAFRENRSEEAFAELVRRYAGLVYSVAKRRLANAALAEDITQIVFIRFAKTPPKARNHAELVGWLHRTTVNVTIDTWRSETRRRTREQEAVIMEPSTNTVWEDISPNLDEALNQLDDKDRQALLLRFFAQKTMREVGAALAVSEDAAKMRVSRAVGRLRTQLGLGVACTAAALGTMLGERSVEAVPSQLVSRLTALRLPAAVGASGLAGMFEMLLRMSRLKLATGAVVLALIGVSAVNLLRSRSTSIPEAVSASASNATGMPGENASRKRFDSAGFRPFVAPPTRAVKVWFRVLDAETGAGLPQTKIQYVFFGPGGEGEPHDVLTDSNGEAPLQEPDDPTKGQGPNVFVTSEGHVPKVVGFHSGAVPTDYTIRLDPAMTVSGLVVDEQGQPVAGVKILVQTPGIVRDKMENVDFQTCPVTSREDGSWSCGYVPKYYNDIPLMLKKPGYAVTFLGVPVPRADLTNLLLVINRGSAITGQVADAQGQPIVNAEIRILNGDPNKRQSAKTDEQGYFTLAGVPGDADVGYRQPPLETNNAGAVIIRGVLPGQGPVHADLAVQAKGFAAQAIKVDLLGETNVANFTLSQGNIFRGLVVDEAGTPIANAVVQTDFNFEGQIRQQFEWKAHTDPNGRFEWDSAPAQEVCYWFEANGYEVIRGMPLLADGSNHQITLKSSAVK
jgi:RNA polymerase sigma factor (sigma-70 family)